MSKRIGWVRTGVKYPASEQEILEATEEQILIWYRFLPSPENDIQIKLMSLIVAKFNKRDDYD